MKGLFINKFIVFMLGALVVSSIPVGPARAATEVPAVDEQALMALFYEEYDLVEATTGSPKPISQVAENVTIVTADEIEAMNVHTLVDVLNRTPGIFIGFFGQDFGSGGNIFTQGTRDWHTLVLIDGVRLNNASAGIPIITGIPLRIIKRIEIIKGPASSTWGSALGGVINIITKEDTGRLQGAVAASYGEGNSQDFSGEVRGRADRLGYYLYGGHQESDGLLDDRYFNAHSLYGKARLQLPNQRALTISAGHWDPHYKTGAFRSLDFSEHITNRSTFATVYFDTPLTSSLNLHLASQLFKQQYIARQDVLGLGVNLGGPGALYARYDWEEETRGVMGLPGAGRARCRLSRLPKIDGGYTPMPHSSGATFRSPPVSALIPIPSPASSSARLSGLPTSLTLPLCCGLRFPGASPPPIWP
jgi:vitamin B12 transporter